MKLNQDQLAEIRKFLYGETQHISKEILENVEIKIGILPPVKTDPELIFITKAKAPLFLETVLDKDNTFEAFSAFRDGVFPYLLIRIEDSWQCVIRCNGEIMENTCDEDGISTAKCCSELRKLCGKF